MFWVVTKYTNSTACTSARDLELSLWKGGLKYPQHSTYVKVASVNMARRRYAQSASVMLINLHTTFSCANLRKRQQVEHLIHHLLPMGKPRQHPTPTTSPRKSGLLNLHLLSRKGRMGGVLLIIRGWKEHL